MTALATITGPQPPLELTDLSTDKLRAALVSTMAKTVAQLTRLAWIVRILEERGEDLGDLKISLVPYLRQIAYGQILPEVVMRYGERPSLVRAISALPLPDQQRLAAGERVVLALRAPDGSVDHRMVDPLTLTSSQVARVFAKDRIRPVDEQLVMAEGEKPRKPKLLTVAVGPVRVDRKRNGLIVGRTFVPTAMVVDALAQLREPISETGDIDDAEEEAGAHPVTVLLDPAQFERLRTAAFDARTKHSVLIRRALIAYGLI